jgi:hypothetical protein
MRVGLIAFLVSALPLWAQADPARIEAVYGSWTVFAATDLMTDQHRYGVNTHSESGDTFQIQCHHPDDLAISFTAKEFLGQGYRETMCRVGSNTAHTFRATYTDHLTFPGSEEGSVPIDGAREAVQHLLSRCAALKPFPQRPPTPADRTLDSAVERLRSQNARQQASAGRSTANGSDAGRDHVLSANALGAIADRLRECWTAVASDPSNRPPVRLRVTTDATGTIRAADIAESDASLGGGASRAYAERARRAALDPQCSQLPLPASMKGQSHTFELTFRP